MIREKALKAESFNDIFVFDIHAHLGKNTAIQEGDPELEPVLAKLELLGVDSIAISPIMALRSDYIAGNREIVDAVKNNPGKVYGYLTPNPHYADCDVSPMFVPGIIGVKLHALEQQTSLDNPGYAPALEFADKKGLAVLFHAWEPYEVNCAVDIAKKYKNTKVILGHSGFTSIASKQNAIEACKSLDNVYIDTAISYTYDGALEWLVSKVGADRVLYGSDLPFFECSHTLGRIALSALSDTDKIKILGENARRLFSGLM